MKILFINSSIPNYVADGLFHGLRSIPGITVIDIPRMDYMYVDASCEDLKKTGSKGSSLYKLLPTNSETHGKRTFWQNDIDSYDYIFFTDIFEQWELFHRIYKTINSNKRGSLCIIDGYDQPFIFPFFNNYFNLKFRPSSYLINYKNIFYFKREYESTSALFGITKEKNPRLSNVLSKVLNEPLKLFPISMSIPEEHIEYVPIQDKSKDFVNYNFDDELTELFPKTHLAELGKWQPGFKDQNEYYSDIRKSKFGITGKRAGWDCLRHYEYAAKGAILCFKNLSNKSDSCAPFELNAGNCIPYLNKEDLLKKLKQKTSMELEEIQENQYLWIRKYTTKQVAGRLLDQLVLSKTGSRKYWIVD